MKNINKNIIALGWVSFFTDMASSMTNIVLPIFIVYVLHEGVDKLGMIVAIVTFVSYIFRIVFGYLSDRYKIVKPFVVAGYVISAIAKPLFYFSHSFSSIVFLGSAERMGKAIRSASKDSLISFYAKDKNHGKTFGFHKMMDIAGELSGALIIFGVFYLFREDENIVRDIFAWTLIPGVLATIIILLFVQDAPKKSQRKRMVIDKEDYKLFPLIFLYSMFLFFLIGEKFLIVFAKENHFALSEIPLLIILFTFIQTITSYYAGVATDKIGSFKILFISFIFGILSMLAIQINLWLSFFFLGLFTILSINAIRSYISINAHSKGFVFGLFYGSVAIFSSLGAFVIGYLWENYGFDAVLKFSVVGMVSILFIFSIQMLRTEKKKRSQK